MQLKKIFVLFFLFLCILSFSCSSSDEENKDLIYLLKVDYSTVCLSSWFPEKEVKIINGNGGYEFFHPKKIYYRDSEQESFDEINFPHHKIRAWIVDNVMYFEGDFAEDETYDFLAYFLLTDKKNQEMLIPVAFCSPGTGARLDCEKEKQILNDAMYWQK